MQPTTQREPREATPPFIMVLFGGTGDLASRKLFPALFALYKEKALGDRFAVVGCGRREKSSESFRDDVKQAIHDFSRIPADSEADWENFASHIEYCPCTATELSTYDRLRQAVEALDEKYKAGGNRVFYMAMSPEHFGPIATNLRTSGMVSEQGWSRLIVEKPFGEDLASAIALNEHIAQSFREDEIYRIDHYLGKEMVQNIEVIRFANAFFEPIWNNRYIDNIQVTLSESVGVEDRGGYYDHAGALKDMVQNHILQIVMMLAMEPPGRLDTEAIRDEKVKVLKSLRPITEDDVDKHVVRAQYAAGEMRGKPVPGYREEDKVDPNSMTETYVAARLFVDNFRWAGVPFYIRTGKRMPAKATEIVIQFKELPRNLYYNLGGELGPNLLVIRVNPSEGMSMLFNAKKPGTDGSIMPVAMDFCNNCDIDTPEAYERLLHDAIHGDPTYFTRWDESATAWTFVEPIMHAWHSSHAPDLHTYPAGSTGPTAADELLKKDGHHWWGVGDGSEGLAEQATKHINER